MALPSSGPLSFQQIATELGVNPPLSLASMSQTAGFTPPYAVSNFYGYGGAPDVVTNGLVLYLDAGQTTSYAGSGSTWTDLSGYGNNSTLVNNPTFNTSYGGNLTFPYSDVYGQINDASSLQFGTGDFTISLWEYPQVVDDAGNQRTILSKNYTGFELFIYQSILRGYFGGVNQLQGTTALTANTWYNFVFIRSAGVITSYINTIQDGQLVNSTDVSNIGTGLYISIRPSSSLYGQQNMSNILMYNRALDNNEIVQNYNAFASRFNYTPLPITSGLTLLLDAANTSSYSGSGTSWNDVSGNNNNGTFNVAPTYNAGGYFELNGTEIVQSFPSSISPSGTSRTVIVWFNMADTNRRGLAATRDVNTNGGWAFVINRTAAGNLTYFNIAGGLIELAAGITPSNWYMATLTYNYSTTTAELFINGVSLGSQSSFGADVTGFNGVLASEQENDFGGAFAGGYSVVNIYNRVLTSSEIIFNYNAYAARFGLTPITPAIVTDGLTLNLDANSYSGTGTWNDLTSNGFAATIQGSVPFTSAGDLSYFTFSGSGNYLSGNAGLNTAATNPVDGTLGVSISAVFQMPDVTQPSILFSQLNGGGYNFESGTQPSNLWVKTLRSFAASNTATDDRGTTEVLSNNVIYLMTWTWDQVNKISTMYVNSSSIASANSGNPSGLDTQWAYASGASFQIAAQTYYGQYGNGNMYKIFAYNKALTAEEVTQNYNALQSRFGL